MYMILFLIGILCFLAVPVMIVITVMLARKRRNVSLLIWGMAIMVVIASCACILGAMLYSVR